MKRFAPYAVLIALIASFFTVRASAAEPSPSPASASGLPASLIRAAKPALSKIAAKVRTVRPAQPANAVRVLVIGSGVDEGVFPEDLRSKINVQSGSGDKAGFGTYAATTLLQALSNVKVISYSVYDAETFSADRHRAAFDWALKNTKSIDAILYAVPGAEFVDPATLLLSTPAGSRESSWSALLTAMGDAPLRTRKNKAVFGAATAGDARSRQNRSLAPAQSKTVDRWAAAVERWRKAREQVSALARKGLPVIAPAGDFGPNFQTIFGIANLADVITVGAFDGRGVARTSSSGPSIDNRVKPDVVAPSSLVGVLPAGSTLARTLPLNSKLQPEWFSNKPSLSKAKVRVDSTIPAAAVVAAQVGSLYASGLRDARVLRGALTLAATPLAGVPVWRQGAGVLTRTLTAKQVIAAGVPLAAADFGAEPAGGRWARRVGFWRTKPSAAKTTLSNVYGVGANGKAYSRSRSSAEPTPISAAITNDGITYTAGVGDRYEAGLYCGYSTVSLPRSSQDFRPNVSGDGLPAGAREHIPACLLNGKRLQLFGFYIHDQAAENLTFALLPDLPERETVMSGFPKELPVDPFAERLYQKVTGEDGYAYLSNVPPGYYRFRQFSDYGNPIEFVARDADGKQKTVHQEIGENPSYQDVTAFLLSATGMTEEDLKRQFGEENVRKEKPTGGYLIKVSDTKEIRVILDFYKKMPGPSVASRVIDLLTGDDFTFGEVPEPVAMARLADPLKLSEQAWPLASDGWLIEGKNAPVASNESVESIVARYNLVRGAADARVSQLTGVLQYPFSLTQPNYRTHISLSFDYDIQNAAVVAVFQAGKDVETVVLGDAGVARIQENSDAPIPSITVLPAGTTGKTSFNVELKSHDAAKGLLTLLLVPSTAVSKEAFPLARVTLKDISMRVATWQRILWPATMTQQGMGHAFEVKPNVSAKQMNHPDCRAKTAQALSYDECETWDVMVHSPGEDAEMMAVRRDGVLATAAIADAGGALFDPRRGVADFSSALSHNLGLPAVNAGLNLSAEFKTNGRFWEQLLVPWAYLKTLSGSASTLKFEITDNRRGRESTLFPHKLGGVFVAPYVPYTPESSPIDATTVINDATPSIARDLPVAAPAIGLARIAKLDESVAAAHAKNPFVCDL